MILLAFPLIFIFVLRGYLGLSAITLWAEDGTIFLREAGFSNLFDLYAGYLTLVPRLFSAVGEVLPLSWIGWYYVLCSALISCLSVFYFLSSRSDPYLKTPVQKLLASLVVVLLPGSSEVFGSLTNAQWYSVITIPAILFSKPDKKYWLVDAFIILMLGLTGPFSTFVLGFSLPLLVLRKFDTLNRPALFALIPTGLTQLAIIIFGERASTKQVPLHDIITSFYFDVSNALSVTLLGSDIATETLKSPQPLLFSLVAMSCILYAIWADKLHPFFISVIFLGLLSILGAVVDNDVYRAVVKINLIDGSRYRFPMIAAFCLLFISSRRGYLIIPAILMFFIGFSSDFLHSRPSSKLDWADALERQVDNKVVIDPPGWVAFLE